MQWTRDRFTFEPHPDPGSVRAPPSLREAGLRLFDIIQLPECSCRWKNGASDRQWHPFVVIQIKFSRYVGLGCTTNPKRYSEEKLQLPTYDPRKIRWEPHFKQEPTHVVINPWHLTYGELLFKDHTKPRKIASIIDPDLQAEILIAIDHSFSQSGDGQ